MTLPDSGRPGSDPPGPGWLHNSQAWLTHQRRRAVQSLSGPLLSGALANLTLPFRLLAGAFMAFLMARPRHLIDVGEIEHLLFIAEREGRRPETLARELLARAITQYQEQDYNWQCWHALSPREQQVAALVCLDLTTPQIAVHLGISAHTVSSHVEHILEKFNVANRNEVRRRLAGWEFKIKL